ncbi:acyl-CoA thioesterase [Chlamydiales bacterium]|nr:acyl-CoA thioesterase [Chlamydiales bacterium]
MFKIKTKVRMKDTDMAGVIYFSQQFCYVHEAVEEFFEKKIGLSFNTLFHNNPFVFVIAHCEANYLAPLKVGDVIEVMLFIEKIGTTSLSLSFELKRENQKVGDAKTVHVCLDSQTRKKTPLPEDFKKLLLDSMK